MTYNPYSKDWVTVKCPICNKKLGEKRKDEIASFECNSEGCSQTEHWFYPGDVKRPGKSVPWSNYHKGKSQCGCGRHPEDYDPDPNDLYG